MFFAAILSLLLMVLLFSGLCYGIARLVYSRKSASKDAENINRQLRD